MNLSGYSLGIILTLIGEGEEKVGAREGRRGIEMGNTCKSVADSCQCLAKTTTIVLSN